MCMLFNLLNNYRAALIIFCTVWLRRIWGLSSVSTPTVLLYSKFKSESKLSKLITYLNRDKNKNNQYILKNVQAHWNPKTGFL